MRAPGTAHVAAILSLALIAVGCGGAEGASSADTSATALAQLHAGLPTGNPPAWYTQRLGELGYRVASLSYESDELLAYRVDKGVDAFEIRIGIDPEQETARKIEIEAVAEAAPAARPATAVAASDQRRAVAPIPAPESAPAPEVDVERKAEAAPDVRVEREAKIAPDVDVQPRAEVAPEVRVEPEAMPEPLIVTLPVGTRVAARLNDHLDSGRSQTGDEFSMIVTEAVVVAGVEALPAGSRIWGYVADVEGARRPNKGGRIVLKAVAIDTSGYSVEIDGLVGADGERLAGEDSVKDDLKEIAVGAGVGGLLGGLLGGGKGVLAGVLIGGGGTFAATKGEQVELPPDTPVYVELRQAVGIPVQIDSES